MAGSAIFSVSDSADGKVRTLSWACTSDAAAGTVSSPTLTNADGSKAVKYNSVITGFIVGARIKPDGSTAPTALYDVELRPTDDATIDYLGGLGDNCSATVTAWDIPVGEVNGMGVYIPSKALVPYAANCGNSKLFTLEIDVALD